MNVIEVYRLILISNSYNWELLQNWKRHQQRLTNQ